ncbi:unnamed protein product [Moneuplotes crassus]|uniref:Uncharacterized protein n=1 Tax=Euplotes crassus TaxID=5936 RepID=A0AAD1U7X7_EUPCR|nr:unnamed protein product [Moneuplotes crassus]
MIIKINEVFRTLRRIFRISQTAVHHNIMDVSSQDSVAILVKQSRGNFLIIFMSILKIVGEC